MVDDKLVALAMVRASIAGDVDSLTVLLNSNPPTPSLMSSLVTLAGGVLESGLGHDRAIEVTEAWSRDVLTGKQW